MATSEPLVPKGLAQGSRTSIRDARLRAGLPLDVPDGTRGAQGSAPPSTGGPGPPPGGPLGLLSDNTPDDFPFLADTPETPAAPISEALAVSAQSSFARAVSARLAQIL